ncbi:unnamed protein product [Rhizoctonia solani]|uniref:Uncharacterized protein n=1 Tax=Rhizoctonia solani TaxID=456999 RepID=A0A8H2WZH4_9AGAM|nr:unnamed protein product [Rhizoctonia solani]
METQSKPSEVTRQPEPTAEMTTRNDPVNAGNNIEQPSGQISEETPTKKKKGCCSFTVPAAGMDGFCTIICGALCCLCSGLG